MSATTLETERRAITDATRRTTFRTCAAIRDRREDIGMSQTDLAHMVNMPLPRLQLIELGHMSLAFAEAIALAMALRVNLADLLPAAEEE